MSCESCKFSSKREPMKLRIEEWQEDHRPIRKGFWANFWNLNDYKDPEPYIDMWDKAMDAATDKDNRTLIYCDRYPQRKLTPRSYHCGDYKEKPR